MAKKMRVKWHLSEWAKLRNSPEVMELLTDLAEEVAAQAEMRSGDDGFKARPAQPGSSFSRRPRARSQVYTATNQAKWKQSQGNILQSALGGSGG